MPVNFDKEWLAGSLLRSETAQSVAAIRGTGRALPCHVTAVNGALVTVAFDVATPQPLPSVTVPKAESNWLRMPTQVGDRGMVIPADALLEPTAQMETGIAPDVQPCNLSGLLFVPVSSAKVPPSDPNAAIAQGPNGFIGQTTQGTVSSVVTDANGTTITFGSVSLTLDSSGVTIKGGNLTVDEDATIKGIRYSTHVHPGVQSGSSDTGAPQG